MQSSGDGPEQRQCQHGRAAPAARLRGLESSGRCTATVPPCFNTQRRVTGPDGRSPAARDRGAKTGPARAWRNPAWPPTLTTEMRSWRSFGGLACRSEHAALVLLGDVEAGVGHRLPAGADLASRSPIARGQPQAQAVARRHSTDRSGPYCCAIAWDNRCLSDVALICGQSCNSS